MCAISGIFRFDNKEVDISVLKRMSASISHRGPDGSELMVERNIGLAHRRLAIIDPSPAGTQPMASYRNRLWITFNGEIFNYKELKRKLLNQGYRFKSHTDTETILYGYDYFGEDIVKHLVGQFAFCIWDKHRSRFFLARDHTGIIPLYYTQSGSYFLFASEVKALLASGYIHRELEPEAVHHYLSMFTIPAPLTIFKNVFSLVSGCVLVVDHHGIRVRKYWDIPIGNWKQKKISAAEAKAKLRNLLISSVSLAKVSDVPIGAFLSGGIDSSTIVAIMAEQTKRRIKTYSLWAEGGEAYDERKYAKIIADKYHTDHTEFTVTEKEMEKELPKAIFYMDQPKGGLLEGYFISKLASKDVKVALSGLGGDELFAGYHSNIYETKLLSSLYKMIPDPMRMLAMSVVRSLPLSNNLKKTVNVADKFMKLPTLAKRYMYLYFAYQEAEKKNLYRPSWLGKTSKFNTENYFSSYFKDVEHLPDIDQLYYVDIQTYTRDDLLEGINMMSMAHGLEVRVPFLNHDLISFAASLPPKLKYKRGDTKRILKDVVREWLPEEILYHKKTGFALPRIKYMEGILKPYITSVLSSTSVRKRGIFRPEFVANELRRLYSSSGEKKLWSEHLRIWILFVFELWCRMYIDNQTVEVPSSSLRDLSYL